MPKRHSTQPGDWESVFARLEELVLANSGEDEFEEIFKLLIAKLFSEIHPQWENSFKVCSSPLDTTRNIDNLLTLAAERWPGILQGSPTSRLTPEHLSICVESLGSYSILDTNLEVMDGAFEYLISRAAKGAKGQYFTPRHVIDCCVQMMEPSPTETILDPACGSGGFLIHALNYVRANHPNIDSQNYSENFLWGCDFERRAIQIARALMLIAGAGQANLYRLNSLLKQVNLFENIQNNDSIPQLTIEDIIRTRFRNFKGFDLIMTNPPFAGEVREPHVLDSYDLVKKGRRIERDVLFLERCIGLLRPGGRLAIVLPHNKLGSTTWSYLREWLIHRLRVVAVLGLGRSTFLPHTHQKTSVLFGVKRERYVRTVSHEEILFTVSEKEGKDSKGHIIPRPGSSINEPAWIRADHDLEDVVLRFKEFLKSSDIPWTVPVGTALRS